ncbi:platelet endothelial cell adhesion molecule isoform X2 [Mastacembelus armatus]|uniref:platelet endothelial cell adhesion molecule isoform X2 n=1 Tax=Mastacembelus armatus TaxID=205130 RepID=UPI000E454626|nr:platelet endothelial cell adhesion molecule-like isoform X2 [Mastacembelus armatus]
MDARPPKLPLLVLTSLLHFLQCARGQPSYIIDTVGLKILPSSSVQSGTSVTLRCQVSVSRDNITHLTHTFQLTRDDVPIHSTTTTEDVVMYELNPARAADSGSYECRVTVKDKRKVSFSQKLDITGLQTPILHLEKTSPYESEEFTATCSAPDEKGSLIFRFHQRFHGEDSKTIKQPAPTGNSSETTLVLRRVGDSFLYCDYEINLISGPRRSNHSDEVQVIVRGLHISPVMNVLPSSNVFEGDVIEVVCKVVGSFPKVEVFLTKERKILKKGTVGLTYRFTVQEDDSGELVCKAVWNNVQKETYQTITVRELFSKPRLIMEPKDIFDGDHFKLTCSVSIYVPEKISNETMLFAIYKDNIRLNNSNTYTDEAKPNKNGNYTCKVQAGPLGYHFLKESQKLVVKAKIPVSEPMLSVVGGTLVLGKHFQLLCHSNSGTLPITYTLHGPDRVPQRRVVSQPGQQAIFNSSAIFKSSDLKNFLCHAKNSQNKPPKLGFGQQLQHSTKVIEPVSKPVLTILPSMSDISEGQKMTLVCSVERGTLPISFTWFHTETKAALSSQTSKKLEDSYSVDDVTEDNKGGYYCESTNPANETKQSLTVVIGVKLAHWKKGLIAASCILLILALILVIAFKRRLLQFKRKTTGKLSVKAASTKVERLSLTQAEVNEAANVTPGMIGKSVWSEHQSGSESDEQNSVAAAEPQYTEVPSRQADPITAPVNEGTDTAYSEVRNSQQGVPEQIDGGAVDYAELNRDTDHQGHHSDQTAQECHVDESDNCVA